MVDIVAGGLGCGKWHPGKTVCVGVSPPALIEDSEVVLLQTKGPAREPTAWISKVDQPAEGMVVSNDGEWASVQVGTKPLRDEDHSKEFLFGYRVIALGLAARTAGVGNNMISIAVVLNKNSSDAHATSISVNFCWCGGIKVPEDKR